MCTVDFIFQQVMPDSGTKMKKSVTSNDESSIVPEIVTCMWKH